MLRRLDLTVVQTWSSAELSRVFQEMDHIKIGNFLKENGGEWMIW